MTKLNIESSLGSHKLSLRKDAWSSMEQNTKCTKSEKGKLIQVSLGESGGTFIYCVKVQRGIKGKARSKADEVLIVMIPNKKMNSYCVSEHIFITDKAVYSETFDSPILFRDGDSSNYVEEDKLTYVKK